MTTAKKSIVPAYAPTASDIARYKHLAKLKDSEIDFSDAPEATPAQLAKAVRGHTRVRPTHHERTEKDGLVTLKPLHGGPRPGAGRPATGRVRVGLTLSPKARARITARARREGRTVSQVIEDIILHS